MNLLNFIEQYPDEDSCKLKLKALRDNQCKLYGQIELDEGFFSTEVEPEEKGKPIKRGRGSQKRAKYWLSSKAGKLIARRQKKESLVRLAS